MTRWLTDDEQRAWRAWLRATRLVQVALEDQLQREAGLPHTYYEILVRLSEAPHRRLRMADLAAGTQSSPSAISHAAARLEQRGWLRREPCTTDRRGLNAVLTDEGFAALEAAAPGHVERVRTAMFDVLTDTQVQALEEVCTRIADGLE